MKLRLYRLLETLFSIPAAFFGDLADEVDTELHDALREAMKDVKRYELNADGVFSGENSRQMWNEINELQESLPQVWEALCSICCKLQEFESKVEESK